MLAGCTPEEKPYVIGHMSSLANYFPSNTPGDACRELAVTNGYTVTGLTQYQCSVTGPFPVWPIIQTCEPALAASPYDYTNGAALLAFAFIGVMACYFAAHGIGLVVKAVRDM